MTTEDGNNHVKLSFRDWVGLIAVAISVLSVMMAAFLHHDRALVQISVQQQSIEKRLDRMETQLERH